MHDDGRPADNLAIPENGRRQDAVVGMNGPAPWIVREEHVAGVNIIFKPVDNSLDDNLQRDGMMADIHAGEHSAAVGCQDADVEVERLVNRR